MDDAVHILYIRVDVSVLLYSRWKANAIFIILQFKSFVGEVDHPIVLSI